MNKSLRCVESGWDMACQVMRTVTMGVDLDLGKRVGGDARGSRRIFQF